MRPTKRYLDTGWHLNDSFTITVERLRSTLKRVQHSFFCLNNLERSREMSFRARYLPTGLGGRSTLTTSDYLTKGYVQISLRLSLSYTTTIRFPLAPNTPEKYIRIKRLWFHRRGSATSTSSAVYYISGFAADRENQSFTRRNTGFRHLAIAKRWNRMGLPRTKLYLRSTKGRPCGVGWIVQLAVRSLNPWSPLLTAIYLQKRWLRSVAFERSFRRSCGSSRFNPETTRGSR